MNAQEAATIAEEAIVKTGPQYSIVQKIIGVTAHNGERMVKLAMSTVPKTVRTLLEKEGFDVTYSFNEAIIKW